MKDGINQDLEIHHGKPVIAHTRVPVNVVLGSLAGGMSYEDVMKDYGLTMEQIRACLAYAVDLISSETIFFTQSM